MLTMAQALLVASTASSPLADSAAACVTSGTEVLYRNYGYDHIVHLASSCDQPATCSVTTDSNPSGTTVTVPAGEHVAVLMFRGSPARAFLATVSCALAPASPRHHS